MPWRSRAYKLEKERGEGGSLLHKVNVLHAIAFPSVHIHLIQSSSCFSPHLWTDPVFRGTMDHCHFLISSLSMLTVLPIVQFNKWHTPEMPLFLIKNRKPTSETVHIPTNGFHGTIVVRHMLANFYNTTILLYFFEVWFKRIFLW